MAATRITDDVERAELVNTIGEMHKTLLQSRTPREAFTGLRTEVHAILQLKLPPPYSDHPEHLPKDRPGKFSKAEMAEIRAHQHAQLSATEIVEAEHARTRGYDSDNAHHYAQKRHAEDLWTETDRLLAQADIQEPK